MDDIATADINLFSFFLKQGVDPNIFDEVSSVEVIMVAVVRTFFVLYRMVIILWPMPLTAVDRTW